MRLAGGIAPLVLAALSFASALFGGETVPANLVQPIPSEMRLTPLPARAPEPPGNPSNPAKVALGRLLFFDSILSSSRDVSCSTCHHPRFGWGDARAVPIGVGGTNLGPARTFRDSSALPILTRNAPSLLNVAFNGLVAGSTPDATTAPMFWDGRVISLERQVSVPLSSKGEMCGEDCRDSEAVEQAVRRVRAIREYRELFAGAFDQPAADVVSADRLANAIAAFERSLVTPPTAYDRHLAGDAKALNGEQLRGLLVFKEAGCVQCHGGPMLSDFKLHRLGLRETGPDAGREFRTPTLRNLRHTAPYMHNGSRRTVRDVLVFYDDLAEAVSETLDGGDTTSPLRLDPLLKHLNLNPADFPALEAFLDTLNSEAYDRSVPAQVPSGLPVQP